MTPPPIGTPVRLRHDHALKAGQRVVCVDPAHDLIRGKTYTVLAVHGVGPDALVNVDQVAHPDKSWSFCTWRFRPLVERETDISVFTKLLKQNELEVRP
jgi:hypothetical protein